jgi:hypothetical protein
MVRNDMKIYTDSLIINSSAFVVILFFYFLKGKLTPSQKDPGDLCLLCARRLCKYTINDNPDFYHLIFDKGHLTITGRE